MPVVNTSTGLDDLELMGNPDVEPWVREALAVPRRDGIVEVDGTSIAWRGWGDESAPGVLLFHGFMAHSRVFSVVAPLLARDRHVVAFDFSGMGDSGWRDTYSEEVRAREAWNVATDAGLLFGGRRPTLVSHSFGSSVAMRVVEQHGREVGGFLLCDMMMLPPDVLGPYMANAQFPSVAPERKVRASLDEILDRFRLQPEQPIVDQRMVDFVARHAVTEVHGGWAWKFDPQIIVDDMHGAEWWGGQAGRFASLGASRAILHGELSAVMPAAAVDHVRSLMSSTVPVVAVPHAHHHLMLDQPIAFVAAVRALIARW